MAAFGASSLVILYQAYTHALPTIAYFLALGLFIVAVASSIVFGSKLLAGTGVFSFFLVIRLVFYVSTRFLVFPFGDPYGQFGVLEAFAQSSHIQILYPTIHIFDNTKYLANIVNQYSQWPGFQMLTLTLANTTGLPLLETAMSMTIALDVGWFAIAYCLVSKVLSRVSVNLPNPVALCLAIITSLPATTPVPTYFKYDFPAAMLMLAGILLIIRAYNDLDHRVTAPLIFLSAAITVTHSITAFVWAAVLLSLVVWNIVRPLAESVPSFFRPFFVERAVGARLRFYDSVKSLFAFMLVSVVSWWGFYAVFMKKYLLVSLPKTVQTISLSSLSQRVSPGQILTPSWIVQLLRLRDDALLALIITGVVIILLRHSIVSTSYLKVLLLTIAAITLVTELSGALSFGDRAFELFAPVIGVLLLMPMTLAGLVRPRLGKTIALGMLILFMLTVGLGFWGASYAPSGLYTQGADISTASGRPLSWPAVASFMSFPHSQSCILTNEIYATSLSVPVSEWNITKMIGNVPVRSGCITIVFDGLYSTTNANVSSFGFGEPYFPYQGFSPVTFYGGLSTHSDRIFDTGKETTYYSL